MYFKLRNIYGSTSQTSQSLYSEKSYVPDTYSKVAKHYTVNYLSSHTFVILTTIINYHTWEIPQHKLYTTLVTPSIIDGTNHYGFFLLFDFCQPWWGHGGVCGLKLPQEGPAPLPFSCCRYRCLIDCMTGWSPEAASPAHVSPSSRRADDPAGDASSITSTTIIRRKTNLVIMAIYELCAPCCNLWWYIVWCLESFGEASKICTALKLSAC